METITSKEALDKLLELEKLVISTIEGIMNNSVSSDWIVIIPNPFVVEEGVTVSGIRKWKGKIEILTLESEGNLDKEEERIDYNCSYLLNSDCFHLEDLVELLGQIS